MARLDLLPRFLLGWGGSFVMKCIICSSKTKSALAKNKNKEKKHEVPFLL